MQYKQDGEALAKILLNNSNIKTCRPEILKLVPELIICVECTQNSPVHIYNVYEHIEETTNDVEPILTLKLAALFHDIGKPYSKTISDGVERFKGHEQHSVVFADMILRRLGYEEELIKNVCTLIKYHNHKTELTVDGVSNTLNLVEETLMPYLLQLKNADLMSHALEYANLKKPSLIELSYIYKENFNINYKIKK